MQIEKHPSSVEKWFTLSSLLFFIGNPIELLLFNSYDMNYSEARNGLEMMIACLFHVISLLFFLSRWKKNLYRLIEKEKLIWLVILVTLLTLASSLWSSAPGDTFRRSIILILFTLYGIYFGTRYTLKQQLSFLAKGFSVAILMSLFFGLVLPQYGIHSGLHQGAWRGIYGEKNALGGSMVLSAILFIILLLGGERKKWSTWVNLTLSVTLLLLSRSSTSLVVFLSLISFLIFYRAFRLPYKMMIPVLILMLLIVTGFFALVVAQKETLVGILGKDLTFTGRTDIWSSAWYAIQKKPLLGYGYQGFWWPQNSEAIRIWDAIGWTPIHPHNGLLKILLEIGWLGTLMFLIPFCMVFIRSLFLAASTKSSEYYWPISFLTFMFLSNLTESNILNANVNWILYVAVCLSKIE